MKEKIKTKLHDFIFDNIIVRFVHFIVYIIKGLKEHKEYFKDMELHQNKKLPLVEKIIIVIKLDMVE